MKKTLLVSALGLVMAMSVSTGWAASTIDGKVTNTGTVEQAANIAIGEDNKAAMGSVSIKDSTVGKTGVVTNKSDVKQAANIAIGKGNEANMGSVSLKNAKVDGKLTNTSTVEQAANIAIGEKNKANMGSVNMEGGSIGKTVALVFYLVMVRGR